MHNKIFLPPAEGKHRKGLLGAHFDCFVTHMQDNAYALQTMQYYIRSVTHFGKYLKRKGIHDIHQLEGRKGYDLVARYRRYCKAKHQQYTGIKLYIDVLEKAGILKNSINRCSSVFRTTQQYVIFLNDQRGLCEYSIYKHKYWTDKFLQFIGCEKGASPIPSFGIADVDRFIEQESVRLKRKTQQTLAGVLRGYFRFLYQSGKLTTDLSPLVTSPRCYKLESLPPVLRWDEVQKVLDSIDRSMEKGLRNYAIFILLSSYGLRVGEVAKLKLEDIKWRKEIIYIAPIKSGKDRYLPLLPVVGKAILEYLKCERPPSKYREIFLTTRTPILPLKASNISHRIVTHHLKLAGLSLSRYGAHLIRHSFATHLKRRDAPFKQISDLLGHQDPKSTHLYTKTAYDDLREVALEVPEELEDET